MRRLWKRAILQLIGVLTLWAVVEAAVSITVTGSWSLVLGSGNLQGGAGSNLVSTYTSNANQALLTVSGATTGQAWTVSVLRIDSTWDGSLVLSLRRTGGGSGTGTVSGGTTYLTVLTTSQTFITGTGNLSNIPLQERLAGVSVSLGAGTFTTTIRYTITTP